MDNQQLDYDSCTQILARLDADTQHDNLTSSESPGDSGHSPFNSASPPGLSSGSVTSPESLRFDWDPSSTTFFDEINGPAGILAASTPWDSLVLQEQPGISPMSDYIKIENEQSPAGYFVESSEPQGTISPGSSLIDPTAQTALEGTFGYGKESEALFTFNSYNQPNTRQNSNEYPPMAWRSQGQGRDEYQAQTQNWQQQQSQAPLQQQRQQQSITIPHQPHVVQRQSPLRESMSPPYESSPESGHNEPNSDDAAPPPAPRSKKRKMSSDDNPPEGGQSAPAATTNGRKQPKKTAHNMIEKRYRTNLNDKIAALRDSVPSLRVMVGTSRLGDDDEEEDLEGLAPAHKLNKATVLAKATEYIRHLEKRNKRLIDENDQLKHRLNAFEKLATASSMMSLQPQQGPNVHRGGQAGGPGGGLMSRLMVGSLAGLMVANGFQSHEDNSSRGLGALPFPAHWMGPAAQIADNQIFWLIVKLVLLFAAVLYIISPGYFDTKGVSENAKTANSSGAFAAPSLAPPLKDRSHAWLTAIQTVWVPRHSVILELAALSLKAAKLSLRRLIGWERYQILTGMTAEQEAARIKSWTIALDAQLAGGDISVNHSRLLLTLLASWTLPPTPARLMLNALHIRVLVRDISIPGFQAFAGRFSNYYWLEARKAQEKVVVEEDRLPEYLAKILELDPSKVFDDLIVQKAFDLAYNRINQNTSDEGMDSVMKDPSVRSPMDALAAWYSSLLLQGALVQSLKAKSSKAIEARIQSNLDTAVRLAPPCSAAHLRALTACAVLGNKNGEKHLAEALKIFEEDDRQLNQKDASPISAVIPNPAVTTTPDIRVSLRCGMALALMRKGSAGQATRLYCELDWQRHADRNKLGLLGFISCWRTLATFVDLDPNWARDAGDAVEECAAMLRIWIGDKKIPKFGVSRSDCKRIIDFCNTLHKKLAGLPGDREDDGYVSGGLEVNKQPVCV